MSPVRTIALRQPDTEEGVACEGTAVEKRTFKSRKKAFLFLGPADAMLKLRESLPEATTLATKHPTHYKVGAHGWVTLKFAGGAPPPEDLLERWIEESYRVVVGRRPT